MTMSLYLRMYLRRPVDGGRWKRDANSIPPLSTIARLSCEIHDPDCELI